MDYNLREMNNAVLIDSLDHIIEQEIQKLKSHKNTGLMAKKLEHLKTLQLKQENEDGVTEKKKENIVTENDKKLHSEDLRSSLPKQNYSPRIINSHNRVTEIERLANIFTQSTSFFNKNIIPAKHNQILNKEKMTTQIHDTLQLKQDNEDVVTENKNEKILHSEDLRSSLPKQNYSPRIINSHDRVIEIERLANIFTQSTSFFNKNIIPAKHNQILNKEKMTTQIHDVKRSTKIGEYSPLNHINKCVNSHPLLMGIGEYDLKKKTLTELQRKDYTEYLSKTKQEKNTLNLQKLVDYPCKEAFKATTEEKNSSEQIQLNNKAHNQENLVQLSSNINTLKSCSFDVEQKIETKRLKQELYRFELRKQIEEKQKLELERKRKEQMDDKTILKLAKDHKEKIKKSEKRTFA